MAAAQAFAHDNRVQHPQPRTSTPRATTHSMLSGHVMPPTLPGLMGTVVGMGPARWQRLLCHTVPSRMGQGATIVPPLPLLRVSNAALLHGLCSLQITTPWQAPCTHE